MNILVINHSVENCGVYQYGKRVGQILEKSKNINFVYLELNSHSELDFAIDKYQPEFIIYNYLEGTLPWVNINTVNRLRMLGIKQFMIVHNTLYNFFDFYLHQNPYHLEDNFNFSLKRPLFSYSKENIINEEEINIGSFGFGFNCKNFDKICTLIDEQFNDKKVKINLHLTKAHFSSSDDRNSIIYKCKEIIKNPLHSINFTQDFLSNEQILNFLHGNDLNIFLYDDYNFYNGISSTIDYALSVKKPIAICKSNMFSHIWDVNPSILIEESSLQDIINNGFTPLEVKYEEWSNDNFIIHVENIIKKIKSNV